MNNTDEFALPAIPPFNLKGTVEVLRRRQSNLVDVLLEGEYRRVMQLDGRERLIAVRQQDASHVGVRPLDGPLNERERAAASLTIDRVLGLQVDLAPVYAALDVDEQLAALAHRLAGIKPPRFDTLWVSFASIVPFQQVSLDAAIAVLNRIIQQLGTPHPYEDRVYYGFPSPERFLAVEPEILHACGLSAAKIRTLRHAAGLITSGELSEAEIDALDDAQAVARLIMLPGIGPWSAQLILLRGFRRLSFFPTGDAGANRNLRAFLQSVGKDASTAQSIVERLGSSRGYLYFLMLAWRLAQSHLL